MLGIYFSGTGNSQYCIETFLRHTGKPFALCAVEDSHAAQQIALHEEIVLAYPVYYSNVPKIVRDFIENNNARFQGKRCFVIATMAMFSGDGAGVAVRLLEKCGAVILGGLHIKMPDNIGDVKLLKKSFRRNKATIEKASEKLAWAAQCYNNGKPSQEGLNGFCRVSGFLAQRMLFGRQAAIYHDKPNVAAPQCNGCGKCTRLCPTKNLVLEKGKASGMGRCIKCYRCFSNCPQKAITILGSRVYEQHLCEKYLQREKQTLFQQPADK